MRARVRKSSNPRATIKATTSRVEVVLFCVPVPASRPRVTRWGTYYPKTYKTYKDDADQAIPLSNLPPLEGNLRATIEFACVKPKTTKRSNPRGDIDNHMKAILDAIVGQSATKKQACRLKHYINDDDQITEVHATKRWVHADEEPHTRIVIEQT